MLALSRNKGESIVGRTKSGEEITITVIECGGRCKLAIDAPESVRILREELITKGNGSGKSDD